MAVLVTGSGLVGSQIARLLVEAGERPVLFDLAPEPDAIADIVDPGHLSLVQGESVAAFRARIDLTDDAKARILHENPKRLYRL